VSRLRGLAMLLEDAVVHGTIAVEKVHQSVARTPLDVLATLPPLAGAARSIAACQAAAIAATYAIIRETSAAAGVLVHAWLDAVDASRGPGA
jgi:ABC-type phosphate/phosphonate transport system permease subunit